MKTLLASVIWLASLLAVFVFYDAIADILFILHPLLKWSLWIAGIIVFAFSVFSLRTSWKRGSISIAFCVSGFLLYHTHGFDWGRTTLFQLRRHEFQSKLESAILGKYHGQDLLTDDSSSKLYAFRWYGGILDNWRGVVYDPTGSLESINDAKGWDEICNHELAGLFGGTYYHCQKVGDGWYICYFT